MIFSGLATMILFQTATTITSWQYSVHATHAAAALDYSLDIHVPDVLGNAHCHHAQPVPSRDLIAPAACQGDGPLRVDPGRCGAVQTYGISIGIDKLGYKIWVVYIVYNSVQLALSYFVFPEDVWTVVGGNRCCFRDARCFAG
ncbi:hypothetical protein P175DRAFT_0536513 [Aspergillus ochraceoroseus IBT 24754]|uniref:Autophagy-related protein n=1 Tax=Aspergillus ochraceoroseus IBT 24754 TaxID=1392256 RepID=A0A2T5LKR3_9EURO|nr:uncharacterized protein P175DRAFT_0536513 [Aspergillus ochraceoroseus IBT 24754]PTU16868.1 hypothetical protein P175DRAFT_0536513 [Aspergillus ochraceoroseus IBT 24754]